MSLNDDSGKDITFDDLFNPAFVDATIIEDSDERTDIKDQTIFGSDITPNEIPTLSNVFIKDSSDNLYIAKELLDISSTIKKSNGICKEDAVVIDSISKGFINDKKPLGFFTEDKSKTQFNTTLQTLDKEVDLNLSKVIESLNSFSEKVAQLTLPKIKELESETKESISSLQVEIQNLLTTVSYPSTQTRLPEDFSVNTFLDIYIRDNSSSEDGSMNDGIDKLPDDIRLKIYNLRKGLAWPNSFLTRLAHLYASQTYHLKETLFCFGSPHNTIMIVDSEIFDLPSDHLLAKENIRLKDINTIYLHSTSVTGIRFKQDLNTLIGLAVSLTNKISNVKNTVKEISLSTQTNLNAKLQSLDNISKDVVRDSLVVSSILSFFEELLEFLFRLKSIYESLSLNKQNT